MINHCLIEGLRDWCGTFGEKEDVLFKSGDSLEIEKITKIPSEMEVAPRYNC